MDTSLDVPSDTINKMKSFLVQLSKVYNVSKDGARISLLTYGENPQIHLKLDQGTTIAALQQVLSSIEGGRGRRHLEKALKSARDTIVGLKDGARKESAKVVIVLTAGRNVPSGLRDLQLVSEDFRRLRVDVVVIGIGPNIDPTEMRQIASGPDKVVDVVSPDRLVDATAPVSGTVQAAQKISTALDIGFILGVDRPGEQNSFEMGKMIIADIVSKLEMAKGNTRIGLITYGSAARSELSFDRTYDGSQAVKTILGLSAPSIGQYIKKVQLAGELTRETLYLFNSRARKDVPATLMVFVNEEIDTPAKKAIERVKSLGVKVIIVYLGTKRNLKSLGDLASEEKDFIKTGQIANAKNVARSAILAAIPGKAAMQTSFSFVQTSFFKSLLLDNYELLIFTNLCFFLNHCFKIRLSSNPYSSMCLLK